MKYRIYHQQLSTDKQLITYETFIYSIDFNGRLFNDDRLL